MRYGSNHNNDVRQRILLAASKALHEEGPEKVAVAGVMSRTGMTHGGFYTHFETKDQLIAEAIDEMFRESRAQFLRLTDGLEPIEALDAYASWYLSAAHRDSRGEGCPLPTLGAHLPRMTDGARKRFANGLEQLTHAIGGLIAAMGRADAYGEASFVLSQLAGALTLARALPDLRQSNAMLACSRRLLKSRFH